MEKRVLVAITLSFLVLAAYQHFFVKSPPRPAPATPASATSGAASPDGVDAGSQTTAAAQPVGSGAEAAAAPAAPPASEPVQVQARVGDTEEREIVVESDQIRVVFSNRGARVVRWQLKRYLDERREAVDLVPAGLEGTEPRPFALIPDDDAVRRRLGEALFQASTTRLDLGKDHAELTFEYQGADGLSASKRFRFAPDGHPFVVQLSADITRDGQALPFAVSSGPGLGDTDRAAGGGGFFSTAQYQKPQAVFQPDGKTQRIVFDKLAASPTQQGRFRFIGLEDHYFLSAVLPGDRDVRVDYRTLWVQAPEGPRGLIAYTARLTGPWQDVPFFFGPKHFDRLAAIDRELVRTINFGMFDWLVVPLLRSLNWLNGYIGNFGWSIIALTALINLLMWPLRHKSMVSMRKMQALQPQVKAIQERYANLKMTDPAKQKMNTEMMTLYREKGVNPASGCVPMLLTFPVLFAFYAMLSQAIELRGAPFVGWITDLSLKDPLFITPVLMGASMVWQQRMTPSTADPVQQKVFMFMPLMFMVMFLWAPSGLVLYWLVSNLFAISQQYLTNRIIGGPPVARPSVARA